VSEGELFITVLSLAFVIFHVVLFTIGATTAEKVRVPGTIRTLLLSLVPAPLVLMPVLSTLAAKDVRDDPTYVGMYLLMGMAWTTLSLLLLRLWGFQLADVTQRRNAAVRVFIIAFALAAALAFAGANIGDGPGFHVVIFSALLGSLTLFGTFMLQSLAVNARYRMLVDRDVGLAARLGLLLVSVGLVAGRAAAGSWVSAAGTIQDFTAVIWPVIPVVGLDAAVTAITRANHRRSPWLIDVVFGLLYLGLACIYCALWGLPP
jgi:hypothetical protein